MKPEYPSKSAAGAQPDEIAQWDPYLIAIVNDCHDAAQGRRSENMSVVVDELDSTALRRRTVLLRSTDRN
jgi:hypothetical protein